MLATVEINQSSATFLPKKKQVTCIYHGPTCVRVLFEFSAPRCFPQTMAPVPFCLFLKQFIYQTLLIQLTRNYTSFGSNLFVVGLL